MKISKLICFIIMLLPSIASAESFDDGQLNIATEAGVRYWRFQQVQHGTFGLQEDISECYRKLSKEPSQGQLAFCITLDTTSKQSAEQYPRGITDFYLQKQFEARLYKAVRTTFSNPTEAATFLSRLKISMNRSAEELVSELNRDQGTVN